MKLRYKIISLILALFVAIFATGTVFAWFSNQSWKLDMNGLSDGAYFAYGDGSATKKTLDGEEWDGTNGVWDRNTGPFGITLSFHMFNLAWLQNTGRFKNENVNDEEGKYYFELGGNVDMEDFGRNVVLPPIGNAECPFESEFNGNGFSISNLIISTNKKVLYGKPADENYAFSSAVGLFGMTSEDSVIKNFILAYPTVEVARGGDPDVDTLYSELPTTDDPAPVGLAVGYVAGKVQSIGVLGGILAVRLPNYMTFNSILGNFSDEALDYIKSNGSGDGTGGGADGAGGSFGNTFDTSILMQRLQQIAAAKSNTSLSSWRLPSVTRTTSGYTLGKGEKLPFVVTAAGENNYLHYNTNGEPYEEVDIDVLKGSASTGYLLGSQTRIQEKNITFVDKKILDTVSYTDLTATPNWFYTQANDWYSRNFAPVSTPNFNNLPKKIKDLVGYNKDTGERFTDVSVAFTTVQVNAAYTWQGQLPPSGPWMELNDNYWSYHGQITWNGQTYGVGLKSEPYNSNGESYAIDGYGHYYSYDGYALDSNNYKLYEQDDNGFPYVINIDGWSTPVYNLVNGQAVLIKNGTSYNYYIDENLIYQLNGTQYLFNFDGDDMRYVSALEGWAKPIYGVNANGYALDENGAIYQINDFYELDKNRYYKRKAEYGGTYVIKTPGWDIPIYYIDANGYALFEDGGSYYYTTLPGVYQLDGNNLCYDEYGNRLILVDGQYIIPDGFETNTGYAINSNGYYYTSRAGSYLWQFENDNAWYFVDADGNKQINNNGIIVSIIEPDKFDNNGYAMVYDEVNDRYYYYDATDNNIFYYYNEKNRTYYQITKSTTADGVRWTFVPANGGSLAYTQIGDNGYAMTEKDADGYQYYYTTSDNYYQDSGNRIFYRDDSYGSYVLNPRLLYAVMNSGLVNVGGDGILYATEGTQNEYVKGAYYTDTNGYVVTTTGAYALENNEITGEKIPYDIDRNGNLIYAMGYPHGGEQVVIAKDQYNRNTAVALTNGEDYDKKYQKISTETMKTSWDVGVNDILAKALTGSANDRLKQAQGTNDDRVQATHDNEFDGNYLKVKTAETWDRPTGVKGDTRAFHRSMGGILLPNNAVWFKPSKAGMIRFVMYADEDDLNFDLIKITRTMHTDGTPSFDNEWTSASKVLQQQLPKYILFYYEYEVTQADIDAGNVEFVIMRDNNSDQGGSYLLYLDIGASALTGNGDGEDPDELGAGHLMANSIDFVYEGVGIAQVGDNLGKFVTDKETSDEKIYVETGLMLSFGGSGTIVSFYHRKQLQPDGNGKTIHAAYNASENSLVYTPDNNKADIIPINRDVSIPSQGTIDVTPWVP